MHVHADHLPHAVLIDCTASDDVARLYSTWLERGIHVITPNKRANTADARLLSPAACRRIASVGAHYLYETTVGAALPIIQTLRDLVQTGDEISEIEGILSGTLSYPLQQLRRDAAVLGARRAARASLDTPSPIRATICRGWTSRARS